MRGAARLGALVVALVGSGCLDASRGEPVKEDAGAADDDAGVVSSPDAGACEVPFVDQFDRNVIGDQWQYYGGTTEFIERGVDGERLTIMAMGGPDPENPEDYAFGTLHTADRFAIAEQTIEADLEADPGSGGDVFFGWLDAGQYLGIQALSNGSMAVVSGTLGGAQTPHCSGCDTFDPGVHFWRLRPDAGRIRFETSVDGLLWTLLTTVDDLPFSDASPAFWAECNQTMTSAIAVDSVVVSTCPQ